MKNFLKNFEKWFARFSSIYIIIIILCLVKVDYYIYMPGNLTDVSSEISVNGIDKTLNGEVDSVYVLSQTRPSLLSYLIAKNLNYAQVVKMTASQVSSVDNKLDVAIGNFDSRQSFSNAELAAYSLLLSEEGETYYKQVTYIYSAYSYTKSSVNYLNLVGKMITGYEGNENSYPVLKDVSAYLATKSVGEDAVLYLSDGDMNEEVTITKQTVDNKDIFGITIMTSFILTVDDYVDVSNVYTQGPSGGAMQALYIYLMLEDEDLLKGRHIAGTGTIGYSLDADGNIESFSKVGAIGCVEQKLYAAYLDHAEVFYCPESNYDDCMEAYNTYKFDESDIRVVKVSYLDDIINDLRG